MNEEFWAGRARPRSDAEAARIEAREAKRIAEDVGHLKASDDWAWWPLLPVKRVNGDFHKPGFTGVVAPGRATVYVDANLHSLPSGTLAEILAGFEKREYNSWEALAAEWMVD